MERSNISENLAPDGKLKGTNPNYLIAIQKSRFKNLENEVSDIKLTFDEIQSRFKKRGR